MWFKTKKKEQQQQKKHVHQNTLISIKKTNKKNKTLGFDFTQNWAEKTFCWIVFSYTYWSITAIGLYL